MTSTAALRAEPDEVFTRRWVVETILDLVGYTSNRDLAALRLLEPSIGSGAFFVPTLKRLLASAQRHGRDLATLGDALFGIDLQQRHINTCRRHAVNLLIQAGASLEEAQIIATKWLHCGDFLLADVPNDFDFIVGNPPYIRTEDLDDDVERLYRTRWTTMRGRSDIYIGFYERSLGLLTNGGRLGFICADRWMHNAYGSRLRELVTTRYAVESVWQMHDVDAFDLAVSAYPAITLLANTPQAGATVIDTTATFDGNGASEALEFVRSTEEEATGAGWEGTRIPSWFETADFWPAGSPHTIKLLEGLQKKFPTLETDGQTRIGVGVATGADDAYIVSKDIAKHVEADRLLPIVMADDIRSGKLKSPAKLLLNPWDNEGKLIDLTLYPQLAKALGAHRSVKNRFIVKRNPDKWHRTIDKVYPRLAEQPKLLLQDMKAKITPVLEPGGYYPHHNLYYIISKSWDLEVLGGLLLSRIAEAFVSAYGVKMRGGTLRFQAQYLRKIAIPRPEQIPSDVANRLRDAFRASDREAATRAAEEAYGLPVDTI